MYLRDNKDKHIYSDYNKDPIYSYHHKYTGDNLISMFNYMVKNYLES